MRAVVLEDSPGQPRVVDDWPDPHAGSGQVIVRVLAVGICGSDLALLAGKRTPPTLPWVPGHETLGEVIETGPGVVAELTGQRVVVEPNIPCLACPACRAGRTSACPYRISLGFNAPGTLAERIAVPAEFTWPVPEHVSDADAVCVEALSVGISAIRRSGAGPGTRCLVIGAGSQGSLLCLALAAQGIAVQVLEPHEGRRKLASQLGARAAGPIAPAFEVVFETSGAPAALDEAVSRTAPGGTVILIGQSNQPARMMTSAVVQRQLTIRGSLIYDHPEGFAETLALVRTGLSPARVLGPSYALADVAAAFAAARDAPGKSWIRLHP